MAKIGDLRVDLTVDSSGVTKGLQKATNEIAKATSQMNTAINGSAVNSVKLLQAPMSEITGVMKDQLVTVQKQTTALVSQMNDTFRQVELPKSLTKADAFSMGDAWKTQAAEVLLFINTLVKAGLITQQFSSRLKSFSFAMLDIGYSVAQLRDGILYTLQVLSKMGNTAASNASQMRLYAGALNEASRSMQMLLSASQKFNTLMLGGGGSGGNGGGGNGGGGGAFNIDPDGSGKASIIALSDSLVKFRTVGASTASSLRSSFKRLWTELKTKGLSTLRNFVEQCDLIASKGGLISKIWKNAGHIVQGIVISQTFYSGLNAIKDAASAVYDFAKAAEDAQMSMTAMFRDADKADRLTNVLQTFAAETAFSFEQATSGARRLLAYGIESKNLLTVMRPLADAAAASGDPQTFDSIAKAIGQIHTKGKLATQEMLQLTEAGIPAFQILQEELGLTKDELGDIGRQGISSATAINALIDGMNKRYGGVGEMMQSTVSGMLGKMKDNLLIIGSSAFEPTYDGLKLTLQKMSRAIESWRATVQKSGFAGLIHSLVSPEVFAQIQNLLAWFKVLRQNLTIMWLAIAPVVKEFGKMALTIGNAVMPIIGMFTRVIASLAYYLTNCTPIVRYFIAAIAGLMITKMISGWVLGLAAAIKSLWITKVIAQSVMLLVSAIRMLSLAFIKSPWLAIIAIAAGGLTYLAATSDTVKKALSGLSAKMSEVFGVKPSDNFAKENDKNTASAEEFSEALGESGEALEDLEKDAKDANKAAKNSLMAFDEVFTIPEELDSGTGGMEEDFSMGDFEIPEFDVGMPDLGELESGGILKLSEIARNMVAAFGETFRNAFVGLSLGAIIGAVIGGILGGPGGALLGAKIGAVAGGIVGLLWEHLSRQIKNVFEGAGIGAIIGAIVGCFTPLGPILGAAIGASLGGILGWFADDSQGILEGFVKWLETNFKADWDAGWEALTETWSGLSKPLVGMWEGLKLTCSGLVDWIVGVFTLDMDRAWKGIGDTAFGLVDIANGITDFVCIALQGLLDWVDGTFGTSWGTAWDGIYMILSEFLTAVNLLCDNIAMMLDGLIKLVVGLGTGDWAMAWDGWKLIVEGFVGAIQVILDGITGILTGLLTFIDGVFYNMWGASWENVKENFAGFGEGLAMIWDGFMTICTGVLDFVAGVFTGDWGRAWDGIRGIVDGVFGIILGIFETFEGACSGVAKWLDGVFSGWWGGAWDTIKNLFRVPFETITGLWNSLKGTLQGVITFITGTLAGNWSKAWQGLVSIFDNIMSGLGTVIKAPLNAIIDAVNWVIKGMNKISFETPDWVPAVGGKQFGVNIGTIPRLAKGGLVTKNTFAELGEGNKHEAVIPLENGTAIDAISQRIAAGLGPALAREMGSVLAQTNTGTQEAQQPLYVGTLIADDRGLRELERKMQVIRSGESRRRG